MKILFSISFASLILLGSYTACGNAGEADNAKFFKFLEAVERGNLKAIERHLEKYPKDINRENEFYNPSNALMAANRNIEVVKLLLEYGADASQPFGGGAGYSSPLLAAIGYCDPEPEGGFDSEADVEVFCEPDADGEFEFFKLLFHSIDPDLPGDCVETYPALAAALVNPEFDIKYAIYMLENNACVGDTYTGGGSIFSAALDNDVKLAKMMIPKMPINILDGYGYYPLHHAVQYGDKSVTEMLLKYDAYPNPIDGHGKTPLDYADPYKTSECLIENDSCPEEWNPKTKEDLIRCNCSEEERREIDRREEIVRMLEIHGAVYGSQHCCSEE